ncbi:hypothetical protein SAMN05444374_103228 [Rhodococcoides kroppenstedtii]|uniref:Helix-turn-helix domain-containing protein n=2 Tax=Rhodococcoides kroppenstedtii TaxID=293050 RepID=A0A1I0T0A8_9NOCA|nr:hypothetical protein SAMN05444374_103228 [Rhodococcus kroppenstedtii]
MGETLADAVKRDRCPLRRSFVERAEGDDTLTPLASLLRTQGASGGQGGALRIALLLSLIWVTARPPYTTTRVAAYWSGLVGRSDDPRSDGARAVRDALHELADRGALELHNVGPKLVIVLRDESRPVLNGEPNLYVPPYNTEPYISVPRAFWTRGLAGDLSGAGIAMYLCSLALTRPDEPEFFIASSYFDERYGISRSSRKRGLSELVEKGVLTVRTEESQNPITYRTVRRNVYRLAKQFQQPEPWTPPNADAGAFAVPASTQEGKRATATR